MITHAESIFTTLIPLANADGLVRGAMRVAYWISANLNLIENATTYPPCQKLKHCIVPILGTAIPMTNQQLGHGSTRVAMTPSNFGQCA